MKIKLRSALAVAGALVLGINFTVAAYADPQSGASNRDGAVTYQGAVEFPDGSSIVGDLATGTELVLPARSGEPGLAALVASTGGVAFVDASTGRHLPPGGPNAPSGPSTPDEPLPADGGDQTVGAGEPFPPTQEDPTEPGTVTPMSGTPDGYKLFGTNTTAYGYIYTSDWVRTHLNRCVDGECTTIGDVDVRMKEYLFGGDSIRWRITAFTRYVNGPAYGAEWYYWCGVNIPSEDDETCRTGDDSASSSGTGPYMHGNYMLGNDTYPVNFSFGSGHASRAKFPMVREEVSWPGYPVTVVVKFRGWDIRRYDGVWKMSPVSGTGL